MKKKVWASSPALFAVVAVMAAMACASWFWSLTAFLIEIGVAALCAVALGVSVFGFRSYVQDSVKSAQAVLSGGQYELLRKFSLPVVLVGENNDMIWFNDAFFANVCEKNECRGEDIRKFIYPSTVDGVLKSDGAEVNVGRKRFIVYAVKTGTSAVLYFIDATGYRELELEYRETRPAVAIACFDNRDEMARNSSSSDDTRIASQVEEALIRWAQDSMGGFLKRLSSGRYLVLTDECHVRREMERRFPVLDTVRSIRINDRLTATVSIGIARGASTLKEAEAWSRNALDMALGRGGDQVAVKQVNDTYEFFGGLSKGVERHDKVRTRVYAASISDDIKQSELVLIMGHKYSDLDCMGASAGMWNVAARYLQRQAYIVVDRSQSLASPLIAMMQEKYPGTKIFITPQEALTKLPSKTLLIVLDTHSPDFAESPELLSAVQRVVVIDHHRMMVHHIENALVFYHEPYASSASEMVSELVQYIGDQTVTDAEADALLAGIMLDTKNFVLKTGVRTFEAAAYLRRRGADTVRVKRLFADSIDAYKEKYRIVSNARIFGSFAIASTDTEFQDIRISAAQAADELLSIQGVDASFVLFPTDGVVNISARSLGDINVQIIMEKLGGGGHLTMAGAQLPDVSVAEAEEKLIAAIREIRK